MTPVNIRLFHLALLTYAFGIVLSIVFMPTKSVDLSLAAKPAVAVDCATLAAVATTSAEFPIDCPKADPAVTDTQAGLPPPLSEPL